MQFDVISIFSEMFGAISNYGITSRALNNNLWKLNTYNPRNFVHDNYHRIDDRPYGGGAGMVMQAEPLYKCLSAIQNTNNDIPSQKTICVLLSPEGKTFNHIIAKDWINNYQQITLICGRYEGIDQRFIDKYVEEKISIGDIVLSGGELAAMLIMDSIVRLLPHALGNNKSALEDSFENNLLDYPHYTKPPIWQNIPVPPVLLSGNHQLIKQWREQQAILKTKILRPDLIKK